MTSRSSRRRPLTDSLPALLLALSMVAPAASVRAADPPSPPKADARRTIHDLDRLDGDAGVFPFQ